MPTRGNRSVEYASAHDQRASTSVIAVVLLVGLTVGVASAVGGATLGLASETRSDIAPTVSLDLSIDGDRLVFTHEAGEPLDVRDLRLRVSIDGANLAYQPPLPFFAARGFSSGPTGPFNAATDPAWTVGETASLEIAGTNQPRIEPGARIEVTIYADGARIAQLVGRGG